MHKRVSFLLSIIICLLLSSCWHMNAPTEDKPEVQPITIQNFSKYPSNIEGCACYFANNEKFLLAQQYIFVANYDSTAYMTINNKQIKFKLESTGREPNTFGDHDHKEVYNSGNFTIEVDIKYKKSTDSEVWIDEGTITITRKGGQMLVTKFYGKCGC